MSNAGGHEGWRTSKGHEIVYGRRLMWRAKPTGRPWPLDRVEPVAFEQEWEYPDAWRKRLDRTKPDR